MRLIDVSKAFATDEQCFAYLETARWPDGVRCPICGGKEVSKITRKSKSKNKRAQLYQCLEKTCKSQFSVTSGTIFHDSHLALNKWFTAIALMVDAKKGMSALQLQRHLGCNYRTAWYLAHRIREAMDEPGGLKLTGTVEIDETYIGGKHRGQNAVLNLDQNHEHVDPFHGFPLSSGDDFWLREQPDTGIRVAERVGVEPTRPRPRESADHKSTGLTDAQSLHQYWKGGTGFEPTWQPLRRMRLATRPQAERHAA